MKNIFAKRIIIDLIIILATIEGWWFIALPLCLIGLWFFSFYIEILIIGAMYDSLFGMSTGIHWWENFIGTMTALSIIIVVWLLKRVLRR